MHTVFHGKRAFKVRDLNKTQILIRTLLDVYDEGDEEWIVMKDLYIWSARLQEVIKVPKWFVTDLASIPKLGRMFISVNEEHRYAAIVHDWLYRCDNRNLPRKVADQIMADICTIQGLPKWKEHAVYISVRLGGWVHYQTDKSFYMAPVEHRLKYAREHFELHLGTSGIEISH